MVKHRSSYNLYVLPLIALTVCLPGCSPPPDSDKEASPFQAKTLPEDANKKNKHEGKCGEGMCGGGVE